MLFKCEIMKNFKIKYYTLFITIAFFYSCENATFLSEVPFSVTSTENFYQTENDFKLALAGCYEVINTSSITGKWVPEGTYARGLFPIMEGCSDVAVGTQTNTLINFVKGNYLPTSEELDKFWSAFYAGISRCNYLLNEIADKGLDANFEKQITSEAKFLRAFYYYHLAVCFGGVPVNTSPYPDVKAPRDNMQTVFNLIVDDLKFAYENSGDAATYKSGANKWAAGAYLGIVYNYLSSCKRYNAGGKLLSINPINSFEWVDENEMSKQAVLVLKDVKENSPYVLLPKEQYTHLFREGTKTFQYKECLFLSEWSESVSDHYLTRAFFFVPNGTNTYGGGYGYYIPTYDLYMSYAEGDIRRDHNITGSYNENSVIESIEGKEYYVPADAPLTSYTFWRTGKYRAVKPGSYSGLPESACAINYPLIRLADVYLQYAEALYFTGDETEARKLFTPIRERVADTDKITLAGMNAAYYKSDFIEELLDERMRELCFESKRRIDLVRFEKTTEAIENLVDDQGATTVQQGVKNLKENWQYHKLWLPIPQTQIDVNSNLIQNPGYSGETY